MKMKKAILLGLCLINLVTNVRAQVRKDTLVLDDNISLKMETSWGRYGSTTILDSIYASTLMEFMLHFTANSNIKILNFYTLGYEINTSSIKVNKANHLDIYLVRQINYIGVRGQPKGVKPQYKPQYADKPLVMRYLKKGKAYYVIIPIDKLNINTIHKGDEQKPSNPFRE